MKYIIITLTLMVAGLICLVVGSNLDATSVIKPYIDQATSILLITGVFTIIQKFITDREMYKNLRELFRIHESIESTGIEEVHNEAQAYNFTNMIEKSDEFYALLNDGNRWFMNNIVALENRFNKRTKTEIFTVDPESIFVSALCAKTNTTEDELKRKIQDTWTKIEERYNHSNKSGSLKIYKIRNYPTYSAFMNSERVVVSLYQCSSGRSNVPTFVALSTNEIKSFFNFVQNDFNEIRKESILVFDSDNNGNA